MRLLLPGPLLLLLAAQLESTVGIDHGSLPTAVRKMPPDAGEKLHHSYCAFAPHSAFYDSDEAMFNGSATYRAPFATHDLRDQGRLIQYDDDDDDDKRKAFAWHLLRRVLGQLQRRQWACPSGTSSCSTIGYPNSCCTQGETCVKIQDTGLGPVGCCPAGSSCGGTISGCAQGNTPCASDIGGGCCIPGFVCQGVGCKLRLGSARDISGHPS
jgi:hypothetical protein